MDAHFSELQHWMRCEHQWYGLDYEQLESNEGVSQAYLFGGLFHRLTAMLDNGRDEVDLAELEPEYGQLYDEERAMLLPLFGAWTKWWPNQGYEVLSVETELRLPMGDYEGEPVFVVGTADRILRDKATDLLWVGEIKTTGSARQDHLTLDPQGLTYTLVGRELGIDVQGVVYLQARKQLPAKARTPLFYATPVPFGPTATRQWAGEIDAALAGIMRERLGGGLFELRRRFNPIPFMPCSCPLSKLCEAWLLGRYDQAKESLYHKKEDDRHDIQDD